MSSNRYLCWAHVCAREEGRQSNTDSVLALMELAFQLVETDDKVGKTKQNKKHGVM